MQVIWQPIGVVGIITAWNFPAYNPARAWAAAIAAGCTIVGKGSEFTPYTTMNYTRALVEGGIPAGVVNMVSGDAASIGEEMINNPDLHKISFTGSTRVGRILMDGASRTHTKLSLELGGNAPVIIMDDVDIDRVAPLAVATKFRNCGQVCISPQRFFVHEKVYDRFLEIVVKKAQNHTTGFGLDEGTRMGPLINRRQQENVLDIIRQAVEEGNTVLTGGVPTERGYFIAPTIIQVNDPKSAFLQREIFGPVMPVIKFSSREDALDMANDTPYGLAAYVAVNRLEDAVWLSENLEFGMVGVNEWAPHGTEAPFGGWKHSGIGHESGAEGLTEYMEKKLISYGGL
jgi:succinate-semialdehyde dehydrogenase/glutarate-semialdehyde dehydrogenase